MSKGSPAAAGGTATVSPAAHEAVTRPISVASLAGRRGRRPVRHAAAWVCKLTMLAAYVAGVYLGGGGGVCGAGCGPPARLDEALPSLARLLGEGTEARQAAVWLRSGHGFVRAAVWPRSPAPLGRHSLAEPADRKSTRLNS